MRHKYETHGIVLARTSLGEMNVLVTLLTPELGLVRARAQGLRRSGAKLAAALATFTESSLVLVRGREGWRIAGSVLEENWFKRMQNAERRQRASRVSGLLLRLVAGEARDTALFPIIRGFFEALSQFPEDRHETIEVLAALRLLAVLGFDAGALPEGASNFSASAIATIATNRTGYITRINHDITASGL